MPDENQLPGESSVALPDLLQYSREFRGDQVLYRFGNGLTINTEIFRKNDKLRILPLGTPQRSLMNHMLNFPEVVKDKDIFEPFAGSGALGFMALKVGAGHVDFLDINPKAAAFQLENAALNNIPASHYRPIEGDIATFTADRKYDLIVANPPFVPTPEEQPVHGDAHLGNVLAGRLWLDLDEACSGTARVGSRLPPALLLSLRRTR